MINPKNKPAPAIIAASIKMSPKSELGGHDFAFTINKKTGKRSDVVIGEVLPE
jgi:hypothetical protein